MKKLIAVSIILVLFSGMAFAQMSEGLKLGAWGRMMAIPLEVTTYNGEMPDSHDKDNDLSAAAIGSGSALGQVRMNFSGGNEFIGFNFQAWSSRNTIAVGDNMAIWAQPFEWLRLDLGWFKYARLRGKVGGTDWGAVTLAHGNEDAIFNQFSATTGALVSVIPNENIYFGAMIPEFTNIGSALAQTGADRTATPPTFTPAKDIYEKVWITGGYNIDGIGLIRAQYIGGANEAFTAKRIELAFALTAIEGMTFDIGAKIYMPFTEQEKPISQGGQVNLGFNWAIDDLGIWARVDTKFGEQIGNDDYVAPFIVNVHLVPSYNLGFATVGLEFGFEAATHGKVKDTVVLDAAGKEKRAYSDFGMGVWLMKNLGKGYLKGGVSFSYDDALGVTQKPHGYIRIPIVAQFAF